MTNSTVLFNVLQQNHSLRTTIEMNDNGFVTIKTFYDDDITNLKIEPNINEVSLGNTELKELKKWLNVNIK